MNNDESASNVTMESFDNAIHSLFEQIETRGQCGVETGFFELDDLLNGLRDGELIVVAGRPSIGKTALMMNIVEHAAIDCQMPSAFLSLEMSGEQWGNRLICSRAQIDSHLMRRGMLRSSQYAHLANVVGEIARAPIWLFSLASVSLDELLSKTRLAVRDNGCKLVVIDYIQLIEAPGESRTEQLTLISRKLKSLALELRVPILCASELNRGMFQPYAPRPRLEAPRIRNA